MNPLRDLPLAQRQLLFVAAVVAVALLSMYVQLLHASVQRGDERREVQRAAGVKKTTQPAPEPRARQAADLKDALAR